MANTKFSNFPTNSIGSGDTIAGLHSADNSLFSVADFLQPSNNLSDVSSKPTSRTNLGLGGGSAVEFASLLLTGALQSSQNVFAYTGTTHTFTFNDGSAFVTASNSGAQTYTLPQTSTTALSQGWNTVLLNIGTGTVTIATEGSDNLISLGTTIPSKCCAFIEKTIAGSPNTYVMNVIVSSGSGTFLEVANNLSDVANTSTSRTNLGLGTTSNVTFGSLTTTSGLSYIVSNTGTPVEVKATNSSGAGSSDAGFHATVIGTNSGDPYFRWSVFTPAKNWNMAIDNGGSGYPLKISNSTAPGTNDYMIFNENGAVNIPQQPLFNAFLTAQDVGVTGDGTPYQFGLDSGTTPQITTNIGNNFDATTGAFTAPVAGNYIFFGSVNAGGNFSGINDALVQLVTTQQTYNCARYIPSGSPGSNNAYAIGGVIAPMAAGDTAVMIFTASGNGSELVNVEGNASVAITFFGGALYS